MLRDIARLLAAMALGALLIALAYQIPVTHTIDIGGYDAAYVQGFYDPERALPGQQRPDLDGSDGSARWTRASSFVVLPQSGLPAQVSLRLRGWRPSGPAPEVAILLNGARELARFQAGADWQEHTFTIDGGLLKPNDVVIEIRSDTTHLATGDPRAVGVLLDRATYHAGPAPIVPYPPQLLYGALAAGLLYLLLVLHRNQAKQGDKETRSWGISLLVSLSPGLLAWLTSVVALALAFLLLYRAQPAYPYPLLRLLPAIDAVLAALLTLRYGPSLARRLPATLDLLALGGLGAWLAAVLLAAQRHLTLSVPGAEKDFRVFALRSAHLAGSFPAGTANPDLDGVLRADGFYNLGYPLLLWLARPLAAGNPFLAARLVAALSGALLLGAGWWLTRCLLGRGLALLALIALALSPLVVEYGLYLGTDMPFAAMCALALALLLPTTDDRRPTAEGQAQTQSLAAGRSAIILAGLAAGAAFLIRHPGLLLLPLGWFVLWRSNSKLKTQNSKLILLFTLPFLITITPQLYVNIRDTGVPLYSEQAKNIWQAVFGEGDWGRWGEVNNSIGLGQVIAQDPARFLANWWNNLRGFVGSGGEDTREFGQAAQLRLLGFPANWLAVAGLLGWLIAAFWGQTETRSPGDKETRRQGAEDTLFSLFSPFSFSLSTLLIWIALYVITISVGLPLQGRFLLPLAPIYALAAAWTIAQLTHKASDASQSSSRTTHDALRSSSLAAGLILLALLWGGFVTGAEYVLRAQPSADAPGQTADALGAAQLIRAALGPRDRFVLRVAAGDEPGLALGKYSAIAHLAAPAPAGDDLAALRASGAQYLLWSGALGAAPAVGSKIGAAGLYTLYRIEP